MLLTMRRARRVPSRSLGRAACGLSALFIGTRPACVTLELAVEFVRSWSSRCLRPLDRAERAPGEPSADASSCMCQFTAPSAPPCGVDSAVQFRSWVSPVRLPAPTSGAGSRRLPSGCAAAQLVAARPRISRWARSFGRAGWGASKTVPPSHEGLVAPRVPQPFCGSVGEKGTRGCV